jgi:hypothetical protein
MIRFRVARYASSSSWRLTVKMTLSGARRARAAVVHTVAEARVIRVWHAHHPEHSGLAGPSAWYASLSLGFGPGGRGARPGTRKKPASALAARHDPACHWHWPLSGRHGGRSRAAAGHRHGEVGMRTWHSSRTLPVLAFVRARTALPGRAASARLHHSFPKSGS